MIPRRLLAPVCALLVLATAPAVADAAATRAEYVAQVDPLCRTELGSEKRVIRQAKKRHHSLVKRGLDPEKPSKPIGRLVIHAYDKLASIQRATDTQIAMIVAAPGDEETVTTWLQHRAAFTKQFQGAGHAFGRQKIGRFFRFILDAYALNERAAELIHDFGFRSCGDIIPGFDSS